MVADGTAEMVEITPRYRALQHCLACGGTAFEPVYQRSDYTLSTPTHSVTFDLDYRFCPQCGLVFMNPQLEQACIDQYLLHISFTTMTLEPSLEACADKFRPEELAYLEQHVGPGAKVLEVGSGDGHLLYYLQQQMGYEVTGIDLSETYVAYARDNLGIDARLCALEALQAEDGCYDLILSKHTFEHLSDPLAGLRKVRRLLKDDGLFILVVPSVYSAVFTLRDMFSAHNYLFSGNSMRRVLAQSGFEIIQGDEGEELAYLLRKAPPQQTFKSGDVEPVSIFLQQAVARYRQEIGQAIEHVRHHLAQWKETGARLVIFGAGEHTHTLLELFDFSGCDVRFLVDSKRQLRNSWRYGYRVLHPDDLAAERFERILISSHEYQEEIAGQLEEMGFGEKIFRIYPHRIGSGS